MAGIAIKGCGLPFLATFEVLFHCDFIPKEFPRLFGSTRNNSECFCFGPDFSPNLIAKVQFLVGIAKFFACFSSCSCKICAFVGPIILFSCENGDLIILFSCKAPAQSAGGKNSGDEAAMLHPH